MKNSGMIVRVLLAAAFTTSGCRERAEKAPRAAATRPDTGGVAVVALASNLDFANGLLSAERNSQEINRTALFLPLLRYDDDLQLAPLLARSWEMQGDTAVVFHLRNDVWWHDSVKTTAHDVEFTYRYGLNPETAYPNSDYWAGWNDVEVVDSFTVRFRLTPQPEALANLPWIPIMPRHLLQLSKPADLRNAAFNQKPVGNGPFRFVEYKPNDRWVFDANRNYPAELGGRPGLDRIIFRIIPDETAQEAEIVAGGVDLIPLRPERFEVLDARPDLHGVQKPGRQFSFIGWNTLRPPFDNVLVRRALTMAINRDQMAKVIRKGRAEVAAGPVPPFHWSYDRGIAPLPFSPDSARANLAAAGMKDRNGDGFLEMSNGKEFRFELKVPANNRTNSDMAELIRSDLAAVGVRVVPKATEFSTLISDVTSVDRKFDAVVMGWENDFRLVLRDMFHSAALKNPFQFASYRNPQVDSILDKLDTTVSRAEATPLWRRFQTIVRDEQPWTFLYSYSDVYMVRDRLQGVNMDIRGALVNLANWWVQ